MTYALVIVVALLASYLRRVVGGYAPAFLKGMSRSERVAMWMVVVALPSIFAEYPFTNVHLYGFNFPEYARASVVLVCAGLYLTISADFTKWWLMALRYSIAFPVCVVYQFWWGLLVGPLVALADWLAQKIGGGVPTPFDTTQSKLIDGWEAWYELTLGLLGGALFAAAPLLH